MCFPGGGGVSHEQFLHEGFIFLAAYFQTKLLILSCVLPGAYKNSFNSRTCFLCGHISFTA